MNTALRAKVERLVEHSCFELVFLRAKSLSARRPLTRSITDENYAIVLRYLWLRVAFHNAAALTASPHMVKLLATCYGYLFADVFLFIPEPVVAGLFAHVCRALEALDCGPKSALYYFIRVLVHNPRTTLFFHEVPRKLAGGRHGPAPTAEHFRFSRETSDLLQSALRHPRVKPFLKKLS